MGGSFLVTVGAVFAVAWFLKRKVDRQPVNTRLIRCGKFSGLFENRACGAHFINKLLKADCQRSANLLQSLLRVYGGLFAFYGMLSAT
ncbi:hypothetical protein CGJ03_24150 [Vibrio parahaemolyticus]|nr:hypothetical protein CGJ03_24150 [Vibrio parahaemolyticus]